MVLKTILVGVAITVIGGLILYHFFGVGKTTHEGENLKVDKSPATVNGNGNITNSIITNITNQTFKKQSLTDTPPEESKLTPAKIVKDIKSRPLYQQDEVGKHYAGNSVIWKVQLASIRKYGDILHVIGVYVDGDIVAAVSCEVKENQYPALHTMQQYDEYYAKGMISEANATGIDLEDCELTFLT